MEINRCFGCMEEIQGYPCSHCGYDLEKQEPQDFALRPGTILNGKYLVGKVLGQGGFGITYIGWDLALERKVAIKEYYPSGQVVRHTGGTLQWYITQQAKAARNGGMEMFLKEARKMSRVDDVVQVVAVRDLFQENETAYIVMNFVEGETLKQRLAKTGPMSWQEAKKIFLPVMEAMEQVHEAGLIHRDLSPDNLMLQPGGNVKILDLGAAKDLNINTGASSMQVAKSGFSPLEQYTQRGGSGTWTDVYALAATMYYSLTGVLPPAAVDRVEEDNLCWDSNLLQALPRHVTEALQNAMILRAKDRTQTMAEFAAQLQPPEEEKAVSAQTKGSGTDAREETKPSVTKRTLKLSAGVVFYCMASYWVMIPLMIRGFLFYSTHYFIVGIYKITVDPSGIRNFLVRLIGATMEENFICHMKDGVTFPGTETFLGSILAILFGFGAIAVPVVLAVKKMMEPDAIPEIRARW